MIIFSPIFIQFRRFLADIFGVLSSLMKSFIEYDYMESYIDLISKLPNTQDKLVRL
jgi:hypothetical protein